MPENANKNAAVSLTELGKAGTAYVTSSSQALKLASDLLAGHENRRAAAMKKVAVARELLAKTKLIQPGEEKAADVVLSEHENALDTLANVLGEYEKLANTHSDLRGKYDELAERYGEEKTSSLGSGTHNVGQPASEPVEEKQSRMVLHERRPRGGSSADVHLRDALLR